MECKPVFVRICERAARATRGVDIGAKPTKAFAWHKVLSADELGAFNLAISSNAHGMLEGQRLTGKVADPRVQYTFAPVETPDAPRETISLRNTKSGTNQAPCTSATAAQAHADTDLEKSIDARVQVAGSAVEMMSNGRGIAHDIDTLSNDAFRYVWYYDRQGILCADGLNITADLPRFLVLLVAFQHFSVEDWGIAPSLNPQGLIRLGIIEETVLDILRDKCLQYDDAFIAPPYVSQNLQGPLAISLVDSLSDQSHCLSGRMSSVLKASNGRKALACKASSHRINWIPEGDVLQIVEAITAKRASEMPKHPSDHRCSVDLRAFRTTRPRIILGIDGKPHCIPRVVMNELAPLLSLTGGKSFVKAWLDIVTCHAFLWKLGIKHGDPSLWNVMVDPACEYGVLTDFDMTDMALLGRVHGSDQTVTIPFMALDLLCDEYWDGKVSRHYYHELEAFLWILPVVFLAFHQGNLNLHDERIKDWFTSDYNACRRQKNDFLQYALANVSDSVHSNFKEFASLMRRLCILIRNQQSLRAQEQDELPGANAYGGDASHIRHSDSMWDAFIGALYSLGIDVDVSKLQTQKPIFDIAQCQELFKEMEEIFQTVIQSKSVTYVSSS